MISSVIIHLLVKHDCKEMLDRNLDSHLQIVMIGCRMIEPALTADMLLIMVTNPEQ
jgi:hypothetical protein